MPAFEDLHKRQWELRVTARAAKRLKDEDAVDLFAVMSTGEKSQIAFFQSLMEDADKAIGIAYVICLPKAQELGLSADEFLDGIDGDVVLRMTPALMRGIADFFPEGDREVAQRIAKQLPLEMERVKIKKLQQVAALNIEERMTAEVDRLTAGGAISLDSADTSAQTQTT